MDISKVKASSALAILTWVMVLSEVLLIIYIRHEKFFLDTDLIKILVIGIGITSAIFGVLFTPYAIAEAYAYRPKQSNESLADEKEDYSELTMWIFGIGIFTITMMAIVILTALFSPNYFFLISTFLILFELFLLLGGAWNAGKKRKNSLSKEEDASTA